MKSKSKVFRCISISLIVTFGAFFLFFLYTCLDYYWFNKYDVKVDVSEQTKISHWADVVYININTYNGIFSSGKELEVSYVEDGVQKYLKSGDCKLTILVNPDISRVRSITKYHTLTYNYTPKERSEWWFKYLPPKDPDVKYNVFKEIT